MRAGRPQEAVQRLETFRAWAAAAPTQARQALVARCEALLGERGPDEAFKDAIRDAPAVSPLDRARTELLYGEWLRRQRRRADARAHLRAALETFRRLGALLWEQRAEAELRATGETAQARPLRRRAADTAGTPDRRAGHRGPDQQGDRRPAVPQPPHHRLPPAQDLHQARNRIPHRARARPPAAARPRLSPQPRSRPPRGTGLARHHGTGDITDASDGFGGDRGVMRTTLTSPAGTTRIFGDHPDVGGRNRHRATRRTTACIPTNPGKCEEKAAL